jgi:hypothetical protein
LVRNQDEKLCNLCTDDPNFTFSLSSGKGKKQNPVNPALPCEIRETKSKAHFTGVNPACPVERVPFQGVQPGSKKKSLECFKGISEQGKIKR